MRVYQLVLKEIVFEEPSGSVKQGTFMTAWAIVSFSRRTLPCEVYIYCHYYWFKSSNKCETPL